MRTLEMQKDTSYAIHCLLTSKPHASPLPARGEARLHLVRTLIALSMINIASLRPSWYHTSCLVEKVFPVPKPMPELQNVHHLVVGLSKLNDQSARDVQERERRRDILLLRRPALADHTIILILIIAVIRMTIVR